MIGFRTAPGMALGISSAAAMLAAGDNGPSAVHAKAAADQAAPAAGGGDYRSGYASRDRAAEPGVDHRKDRQASCADRGGKRSGDEV